VVQERQIKAMQEKAAAVVDAVVVLVDLVRLVVLELRQALLGHQ
jgi:hypothetical protein